MRVRTHTPIRSCVGCGQRAAQAHLLRFVAAADRLQADLQRRAPGRGAYLHRAEACWDAFATRKPPLRSLRRSVNRPLRIELIHQLRDGTER